MKKLALALALVALGMLVGVSELSACHKGSCGWGCAKTSCHKGCGVGGCVQPCHQPCHQPCAPCSPAPCAPAGCKGGCQASLSAGDSAILVVRLPSEARLSIQGQAMSGSSDRRVFQSPSLEKGKSYVYTLKATLTQHGQTHEVVKQVRVHAGAEVTVELDFPATSVAAK
jgi:uncharacterized protein (TIGR03000 family)